jgi:hypothetical protein
MRVLAYVALKSRSGLSIFNDFDRFTFSNVKDYLPRPSYTDRVVNKLGQAEFEIEAQTKSGSCSRHPRRTLRPNSV